jgi:hypothetical protein
LVVLVGSYLNVPSFLFLGTMGKSCTKTTTSKPTILTTMMASTTTTTKTETTVTRCRSHTGNML